jgi:hypothetical protein
MARTGGQAGRLEIAVRGCRQPECREQQGDKVETAAHVREQVPPGTKGKPYPGPGVGPDGCRPKAQPSTATGGQAGVLGEKKSAPVKGRTRGEAEAGYLPWLFGTDTVVVRVVALPAASRASTVMV